MQTTDPRSTDRSTDPEPLLLRPESPDPGKLAEWIERAALCDLVSAMPREQRRASGVYVTREHGALGLCAAAIDSAWVNRLFTDGTGERCAPEDVHAVLERLTSAGAPRTFAHGYGERTLEAALEAHGLARYPRPWMKLVRGRAPLEASQAPRGISLRAAELSDATGFAELVARCFDMSERLVATVAALVQRPRWHVYLAFDGEQLVGSGALFVHGNVAHLGFGAVAPEARGRGVQRALIDKRIRVALALGATLIASETGVALPGKPNPSEKNLRALGLSQLALRHGYERPGLRFE